MVNAVMASLATGLLPNNNHNTCGSKLPKQPGYRQMVSVIHIIDYFVIFVSTFTGVISINLP